MGILEGILFSIALAGVTGWGFFMLFKPSEVNHGGLDRSSWLLIGCACLVFLIIEPLQAQDYWRGSTNRPPDASGDCFSSGHPDDKTEYVGPTLSQLEQCSAAWAEGFPDWRGCNGSAFVAQAFWTGLPVGEVWNSNKCCISQCTWDFADRDQVGEGQIGTRIHCVHGNRPEESCSTAGQTGSSGLTIFNHNCPDGVQLSQFFPGEIDVATTICMGGCEFSLTSQDSDGNATLLSGGKACNPDQRPDGSTCTDAVGDFDADCWCELNPSLCKEGVADSGNVCESRPPTRLVYHECPAEADSEGQLDCTDSDYSQSNWPLPGGSGNLEVCYNGCTYITDGGIGEGGAVSDDIQLWAVGNPWEKGQWSATYETTIKDEAGNVIWTAPTCEGGNDVSARDSGGEEVGEGDNPPSGGDDGVCDPAVEQCGSGSGSGGGSGSGSGGGSGSTGSAGSGVDTGQCDVRPACGSASSVECALLRQQWRTMCEIREGGDGEGDGWENDLADVEGDRVENDPELAGEDFFVEKDVIESFDDSGFLSSSTCPDLGEFQIAGQTYTFEGQTLCDVLSTVGFLVLASAVLGGALIVLRA